MPVDHVLLEQELAKLPESSRWVGRPEANHLAALLNADERVLLGVTGMLIESGKLAVRSWLLIVTSQRLLGLLKGGPEGLRKLELPVTSITAAYTNATLTHHEVIVESSGRKLLISGLRKESAIALSSALISQVALREQLQDAPRVAALATPAGAVRAELSESRERIRQLEAELQKAREHIDMLENTLRISQSR
ncbi:MAG: PH domain-containing protein [Gemmatimonadota bacterium]